MRDGSGVYAVVGLSLARLQHAVRVRGLQPNALVQRGGIPLARETARGHDEPG